VILYCVYVFLLYLPSNYMEQETNKQHFNLQPTMSHLPCNYMEQEANKHHHIKQEYLSLICKQKLQ